MTDAQRAKVRAGALAYAAAHRAEMTAKHRKYRTANPEYVERQRTASRLRYRLRHARLYPELEGTDRAKALRRDRARRYRAAHPDKIKVWSDQHYQRHAIEIKAKWQRRYLARTPEQIDRDRERDARYRRSHRELFRQACARWRFNNPDKVKARNDQQTIFQSAAIEYLRQRGMLTKGARAGSSAVRQAALTFLRQLGIVP